MVTTKIYVKEFGSSELVEIFQDTGASTKQTIDSSLNSGALMLTKQARKDPYVRFTGLRVVFSTDGEDDRIEDYVIWDDESTLESKGLVNLYIHDFIVIEPTKYHERILLGSKMFSRNADGSAQYTLLQVIEILHNIARTKTVEELNEDLPKLIIPQNIKNILSNIDAPALGFTNPTLREAINGTLSWIDAIYELDMNFNMILRFFNEETGQITDLDLFDDEMREVSGEYYSTEMDVIMRNVVDDIPVLPDNVSNLVRRHSINYFANRQNSQNPGNAPTFGISASLGKYFTTEDVVLGDLNQKIKLSKDLKIYVIEDVYFSIKNTQSGGSITRRATDFFVTEAQYAQLENAPTVSGVTLHRPDPNRQNTVRYLIGGSEVIGFGDTWSIFDSQSTLQNMIWSLHERQEFPVGINLGSIKNDEILITFIYRAIAPKMRVTSARTDNSNFPIKSSIRENQSENFVSAQNYGSNLHGKANRMGNVEWTAPQTVFKVSELYERGFVTPDGFIVTEVEKVIYPTFLKVRYKMVENFNKLNEYIGLNGLRRQFELLPEETTDRYLNHTEYLQIIPGDELFDNDTTFSDDAFDKIIDSLIKTTGENTIRGVLLESEEFDIDGNDLENTDDLEKTYIESDEEYWESNPYNRVTIIAGQEPTVALRLHMGDGTLNGIGGVILESPQLNNVVVLPTTGLNQDNHYFEGWYTRPDFAPSSKVTEVVMNREWDVYARFIPNDNYLVTYYFMALGGYETNADFQFLVPQGQTIAQASAYPTFEFLESFGGYPFACWTTQLGNWFEPQCVLPDSSTYPQNTTYPFAGFENIEVNGNITLYARYTNETDGAIPAESYTINVTSNIGVNIGYSSYDGEGLSDNFSVTLFEGSRLHLDAPSAGMFENEDYGFSRWESLGEVLSVDREYSHVVAGNKSIEAIYTQEFFIMTFNSNGGSLVDSISTSREYILVESTSSAYNNAQNQLNLTLPEGWNESDVLLAIADNFSSFYNQLINGSWNSIQTVIRVDDGLGFSYRTYNYISSPVEQPDNPTRIGYTFDGWYLDDGTFQNGWNFNQDFMTENTTLHAKWLSFYTVTFKDYDGTTLKTETVLQGDNATAPSDPTRTGYTFTGWDTSFTNVTSNLTVIATYSINTYTVTFYDHTSTVVLKSETVPYGGNATPPDPPEREGHTFTQWAGNYENVMQNETVVATYLVVQYEVYFDSRGGSAVTPNPRIVEFPENTVDEPSDPTRLGYIFTGWYTNTSFTNVYNFSFPVNGDFTLYAGWDVDPNVTVSWQSTSKTTVTSQQLCNTVNHIGNVRESGTTCQFVNTGVVTIENNNISTSPSCAQGVTRIVCVPIDGGQWECYEQSGVESVAYQECKLD